jgi:diadenosine tetraphosphate (Ap4A) HIT family hydrolase
MNASPFITETELPFVAIKGLRNGYIQLASSTLQETYEELEALQAKRVYWLTLSEAVPHLHIHLYPRWFETEPKGLSLFEQRNQEPQPLWNEPTLKKLEQWAKQFNVHLL